MGMKVKSFSALASLPATAAETKQAGAQPAPAPTAAAIGAPCTREEMVCMAPFPLRTAPRRLLHPVCGSEPGSRYFLWAVLPSDNPSGPHRLAMAVRYRDRMLSLRFEGTEVEGVFSDERGLYGVPGKKLAALLHVEAKATQGAPAGSLAKYASTHLGPINPWQCGLIIGGAAAAVQAPWTLCGFNDLLALVTSTVVKG